MIDVPDAFLIEMLILDLAGSEARIPELQLVPEVPRGGERRDGDSEGQQGDAQFGLHGTMMT
jgi:hypothetical protein